MSEKLSSSRKHYLKGLILQVGKGLLEKDTTKRAEARKRYMEEKCPPLVFPVSLEGLEYLCKELYHKINIADEERYDLERKVTLVGQEVDYMKFKMSDLRGKFKKPPLKKVRMSADAMLKALLGSKHTVTMDLRANLKQVKKEVKEEEKELRDMGDWRKNIEDKAGMGGRKKMFEMEA